MTIELNPNFSSKCICDLLKIVESDENIASRISPDSISAVDEINKRLRIKKQDIKDVELPRLDCVVCNPVKS